MEPLLASCVPNLHLNNLIVNFQCLYLEINSYSAKRILIEDVVGKPQEKRCLADSRITNQNYLVVRIDVLGLIALHILVDASAHPLYSLIAGGYHTLFYVYLVPIFLCIMVLYHLFSLVQQRVKMLFAIAITRDNMIGYCRPFRLQRRLQLLCIFF